MKNYASTFHFCIDSWHKLLLAFFLSGVLYVGFGQLSTPSTSQYVRDFVGDDRQIRSFDNRYEGVRGSPFLFEDWTLFRIAEGGNQYTLHSRLEAHRSMIIYKVKDLAFEKSLKAVDSTFLILKDLEIPIVFISTNKTGLLFKKGETVYRLEILKQLKKADYEGAYSQKRNYDEFVTKVQLSSKFKSNTFEKAKNRAYERLRTSKGELIKLLKSGDLITFEKLIKKMHAQ